MNMVRYREDEIPPLTSEYEAEVKALDERIASGEVLVDCSDMPEVDEKWFKNAIPNPFYRPEKVQATTEIDSDVPAWFERKDKVYHTYLNAILRKVMLREIGIGSVD